MKYAYCVLNAGWAWKGTGACYVTLDRCHSILFRSNGLLEANNRALEYVRLFACTLFVKDGSNRTLNVVQPSTSVGHTTSNGNPG